jgi:hypothetical protein
MVAGITVRICGCSLLVGISALGLGSPISGQSFVPARVAVEAEETLSCPHDDRANDVMMCQAVVDEAGDVQSWGGTHCFGDADDDPSQERLLRQRIARWAFEPATIDGQPVEVYVSFRVVFHEQGGRCAVSILPNLGVEQDKFGVDYYAPQELYTDGGWIARTTERRWSRGRSAWTGFAFAMSVMVDESGNASDGRVEVNNTATQATVDAAVRALEQSRFIPAVVDGVPRAARYYEFMYLRAPRRDRHPLQR